MGVDKIELEQRTVLVAAPLRGDSKTLFKVLSADYRVKTFEGTAALALNIGPSTGLIVLTEEALSVDAIELGKALDNQPSWSDVPIILLASNSNRAGKDNDIARKRLPAGATNVVVLERPMSSSSLRSAVAAAWKSRERQLEIRDTVEELAQERERFRVLLENIPVGVSFVDIDGRSLVSNPIYDRYVPTGIVPSRPGEGHAQWLSYEESGEATPPETFPSERALRGELVDGAEFKYLPANGEPSWTSLSAVPLRNGAAEIIGAALVIVDISVQKRAEVALREFNEALEQQVSVRTEALELAIKQLHGESTERERAEEQLRQSLKMEAVGQLTGGIAHDFNNMLTGVLGALDLISLRITKGNLNGVERYLNAAQVSARRAAGLTERLLAFSRRQSLDAKAFAVNDLVIGLQELLQRSITEQIQISLSLSDKSPWALADANQLENALLNLVLNARDAMPHGGRIRVSSSTLVIADQASEPESLAPGPYVRLDVEDTGSGIPAEILNKIIEPFFTTKPLGQGTGLGLSMVYGFAKQSHGRLVINSTVGEGTTVSLYLPAATPSSPSEAAERHQTAAGLGQYILLVEDDDSVRMLNHEVLTELGYSVVVAVDGQQALGLIEAMPRIDLLVTDVGLPGMNGRQLAEIVQQQHPHLPVLFLTGYSQEAASRADFLGNNMKLLTKPFTLQALAATVNRMLGSEAVNG